MKTPITQRLMNFVLRFIFFGYAATFATWWYIAPKGFPVENLRFWSNNIIPIVIIIASLLCWIGVFRSQRFLLWVLIPSYPAATLAFIVASILLYPVSMRPVFLIPLLIWLAVLVLLTVIVFKRHPIKKTQWIPALMLAGLSILTGAILPWSQQSWEPTTHPLNQEQLSSGLPLNNDQSPFSVSSQVTVLPRYAEIMITDVNVQLRISPLLTFYSCSPDRCWILFAPLKDRIGTKRSFDGMRRIHEGLYLEYSDKGKSIFEVTPLDNNHIEHGTSDKNPGPGSLSLNNYREFSVKRNKVGKSILRIIAPENKNYVELNASCELPDPVYSHLNTFTEFSISGKEKIFVSFSPCSDKRIEVTAFDYPFGRPGRQAYLDKAGLFRVVQAKSAEKGPYTTLAEGILEREQPLEMTLYDGDVPVCRIIFKDWAKQCSTQLSPTAGWGLPENAIEFSLDGENRSRATFYVTLASTSAGRGFDTVGHSAGIYRNRMKVELLKGK